MDALLSTKSSALCFNKDEFMVTDFSVDKFVSDCRKYASLETMREDLNVYHKILCSAMIELINKDYADFVNLSSNLVGLDKSIKNLTSPLVNLKNEIEQIKCNLDETLDAARCMFSERASIHTAKVLSQHVLCVLEGLEKIENMNAMAKQSSIQSEVLERIAIDFNLVQFHMTKISSMKHLDHKKEEVEEVAKDIEQHLERMFLHSLSNQDVQSLLKVLRIYSVINKEKEVENCFRQSVVKPFMRKLITQQNITKHGLAKVHAEILEFIPNSCSDLLHVTRGAGKNMNTQVVPGYDFLVNSVWPEVILCFEYIAPVYIYAPGDPKLFHENYSASMKFLKEFEYCCGVLSSVKSLRKHSAYEQFLQKWNLDLYFQIRFQEIAGRFESSLLLETFAYSHDSQAKYMLNSTSSLWSCLNLCWDDSIFLLPLKNQFWKLTLQLLSRYSVWSRSALKDDSSCLSSVQVAVLIRDMECLFPEVRKYFNEIIQPKICIKSNRATNNHIEMGFEETMKLLKEILTIAGKLIGKLLINKCSSHLKLISDIPRLYRKTNREVPSKPSGYVTAVLNPLTDFLKDTDSILSADWRKYCLNEIVEGIVKQCVVNIQDVLTSIKKMEDSLKILKRARDKPVGLPPSGAITDDDKIRHQLAIDVNYLEELVQKSGLQTETEAIFKELKELVTSAERISLFPSKT